MHPLGGRAHTIDPELHRMRRGAILDAAYRQFALAGYDRTTTAAICRDAGISSGTFFHYFPTKLAVMVGILAAGTEETREQLRRLDERNRGLPALVEYAEELEAEMADEHYGGFVHAVSGIAQLPEIQAALAEEAELTRGFLRERLAEAAADGELRKDASVESLARWTTWLIDGAAEGAVESAMTAGQLPRALRALLERRP
jgi:AcrR family transcriptional regulator